MFANILIPNTETLSLMCAVCVSDRSGGQIALIIIITSLICLGVLNWAWKKFFIKKKNNFSLEK